MGESNENLNSLTS